MHASSTSNSDSSGEDDYDQYEPHGNGYNNFLEIEGSGVRVPEDRVRQHQLFRGSVSTKRVASKTALASLQTVQISGLPQGDRSKSAAMLSGCFGN